MNDQVLVGVLNGVADALEEIKTIVDAEVPRPAVEIDRNSSLYVLHDKIWLA